MSKEQWGHGYHTGITAAKANQGGFIGMCFLARTDDGKIEYQGSVERKIDDTRYFIRYFSFLDGSPNIGKVVDLEQMMGWDWFATDKDLRRQYAKEMGNYNRDWEDFDDRMTALGF